MTTASFGECFICTFFYLFLAFSFKYTLNNTLNNTLGDSTSLEFTNKTHIFGRTFICIWSHFYLIWSHYELTLRLKCDTFVLTWF